MIKCRRIKNRHIAEKRGSGYGFLVEMKSVLKEGWEALSPGLAALLRGAMLGTHRHSDIKTTVKKIEKDMTAYLVFENVLMGNLMQ